MAHRSGFVNIIGNPNVGKSTLMNALVGEKLSIVTAKAQTTRHRIMGIVNGEDWQIVYSDTPDFQSRFIVLNMRLVADALFIHAFEFQSSKHSCAPLFLLLINSASK